MERTTHVPVTQVSRLMDKPVWMLMSARNYLAETESVPMRPDLTGQIFENLLLSKQNCNVLQQQSKIRKQDLYFI